MIDSPVVDSVANNIILDCQKIRDYIEALPPKAATSGNNRGPSKALLINRVESLCNDGRLSAATRALDQLADMVQSGSEAAEQQKLTFKEACAAIQSLHPEADEFDEFDFDGDEDTDPVYAPLQLGTQIVEDVVNIDTQND